MKRLLMLLVMLGLFALAVWSCSPPPAYLSTDNQILRLEKQILDEVQLQTKIIEQMHDVIVAEIG